MKILKRKNVIVIEKMSFGDLLSIINDPNNINKFIIVRYFGEIRKKHILNGNTFKVVWSDGIIRYYKDEQFHREDGPAVIYPNGRKHYYQYNRLHRENGPAVILPDGTSFYFLNGIQLKINIKIKKVKKIIIK